MGIIQMPKNEFFNTGISTYIWAFKNNKPESIRGRMFLLNAESLFSKMRKSLGNKNNEIIGRNKDTVVRLISEIEENAATRQAMLNDGMALARSIQNRMITAPVAGWVGAEDTLHLSADNGQKLQARLDTLNEIHLKPIKVKEGTPEEPALLRLMPAEEVHYSKVLLELTRTNEQGALADSITIAPKTMEIDSGKPIPGSCTLTDLSDHLTQQTGDEVGADVKSIERALKALTQNDKRVSLYDIDGLHSYLWNPEDRTLLKDGQALGRARLDLKVKAPKKASENMASIQVTFGPDVEKDTETAPFKADEAKRTEAIEAFLARWVKDPYAITQVQTGCEINFNRLFPKTGERKTLTEVNRAIADLDAAIARLHQGGV